MFRLISATVLFSFLPIGTLGFQALAQTDMSGNEPEQTAVATVIEPPLRGVMILRVSERYLEELFARDINKRTPVTRVVLGTHATGTAHTKGRADVDTKPDHTDAVFDVSISGSTTSRTIGRNGSAIIHSYAVTGWSCQKTVRFNGKGFVTSPTTIESETHITPLGADSSLPRLRGRIVARIAARRAVQYNSAAERIVDEDTQKQVREDIDRIIEGRIAKLNQRVGSRSLIASLLPKLADAGAEFSTSSKCINIIFGGGPSSRAAKVCPAENTIPDDTELWIHKGLIVGSETIVSEVIDNAGDWLKSPLPDVGFPGLNIVSKLGALPLGFEVVGDWIVIRSGSRTAPSALATGQQVRAQ